MTTSQYINNFLTAYRDLNNIPGESISDSHVLSMFLHGIIDPNFATLVQIQRNKNEGLEEAALASRKEDQVMFVKKIERKRYRSTIRKIREKRYGIECDGDDNDGRKYGSKKKARRLGRFWKVDETEISVQGFINVPDQIWRNKLSMNKKDYVVAHNAKKQRRESAENLTVPKRFKRLLKERESQGQEGRDEEKIAKRRLGFNLDDVREDEKKEE
jgi:hypothetical protein